MWISLQWTTILILLLNLVSKVINLEMKTYYSRYRLDLLHHVEWNRTDRLHRVPIPGSDGHSVAYLLKGTNRLLTVNSRTTKKALRLLHTSDEFSIVSVIRQEKENIGTILSIGTESISYLSIESSGRKRELRLRYRDIHKNDVIETFPINLADNQWHTVALGFSSNQIKLLIDCETVSQRIIGDISRTFTKIGGSGGIDMDDGYSSGVHIWLGQRNARHSIFKGAIEQVQLLQGANGYLQTCPYADTECPTCAEFRKLQHSTQNMLDLIEKLSYKLEKQEARISDLEKCDCQKSCTLEDGTRYKDGDEWSTSCQRCSCIKGKITCKRKKRCPDITCSNPVIKEGQCCPRCPKSCRWGKRTILSGETFCKPVSRGSFNVCQCNDGERPCGRIENCTVPQCSRKHQVQLPNSCCKICKPKDNFDFCEAGHNCHPNATCYSLEQGPRCQCNPGFSGDGKFCQDINECESKGGYGGNYCDRPARCQNTVGSYKCVCPNGFKLKDNYTCEDEDECSSGKHHCHKDAICSNYKGRYVCRCRSGYKGDGRVCQPICDNSCRNGGRCVAPATCQCRKGYMGQSCQLDIDECALGIASCHSNSECLNVPGSYYCKCKPGFYSLYRDNQQGSLCKDVNECSLADDTCPAGSLCINRPGGYDCVCYSKNCNAACEVNGNTIENGTQWQSDDDTCSVCSCLNGKVKCQSKPCDCTSSSTDISCCPGCDRNGRCTHQVLPIVYRNGDAWIYNCQQCQCLGGEIECEELQCPRLHCEQEIVSSKDCCPRCADPDVCLANERDLQSFMEPEVYNVVEETCRINGIHHQSGASWKHHNDKCTTCTCRRGHICCTHDQTCTSRRNNRQPTNNRKRYWRRIRPYEGGG